MRFKYFEIGNFRGIEKVRLDLSLAPRGRVFTLVGLNESGKTTILEAMNFFGYNNDELDPLDLPGYRIQDVHTLIPISKRSNFNGNVTLKAGLELTQDDVALYKKHLFEKHQYKMQSVKLTELLRRCEFKNSKVTAQDNTWDLTFTGTYGRVGTQQHLQPDHLEATKKIVTGSLPTILYFPNFLFEFPDRIYLESISNSEEDPKHEFYRAVLQDILNALDNSLDLNTHILKRAKSTDSNDQSHLRALLLEMGRNITGKVFSAWNQIFHREMRSHIRIECVRDDDGHVCLEFRLEDADGIYLINERSLGFRWFFVFLLLTQYRGARKNRHSEVMFLFDEPASNLHPSAQSQLLQSFSHLSAGGNSSVVYTTHSHHLINPEWLENTFIVRNEGLDYDGDEDNFSSSKTKISLNPYRKFVAQHPTQTNYFRPILDVLDYAPSKLEFVPKAVMVEGKCDYYTLKYACFLLGRNDLALLPGTGAGNMNQPIQLYLAWGHNFLVLLDSDEGGKKEATRYRETFGRIVEDKIFNLHDIEPEWDGLFLEGIIAEDDREAITAKIFGSGTVYTKNLFNRAVQELLITGQRHEISDPSKANLTKLIDGVLVKLGAVKS